MKRHILSLLLIAVLFTGCSAQPQPAPDYAPGADRQLTIYTSHKEDVYLPIVREFESRTGIWVNVVTGGTNELLEQIAAEADAPVADVMFGGGVENLESYRSCFTPYVCADFKEIQPQFQGSSSCWTPFSSLPVVLIYNTKLVNPSDLTSWDDLYKSQFSGRIAFADPALSGSSFTALVTQIYASELSPTDSIQRLVAALEGKVLSRSGDVLDLVSNGTFLAGITLEETALKYIAANEDIAIVYPTDGTSCVPDGSALIRNAPHSENAKRFLDFTVSHDVQQLLPLDLYRRPVRSDVPSTEDLPSLETIALVSYDVAWVCEKRSSILDDWTKAIGEGLS